MPADSVSTRLYPAGMLNTLSRHEVERLTDASRGELADLLRRCALAVLNSGNQGDDAEALLARYRDFELVVQQVNRGLRLELKNAPGTAFVDGRIIEGIRELLSAVIRDLVYFDSEISGHPHHDLTSSAGITNAVFEMLRNARALIPQVDPDLVVCWGGHSISREEYDYTKVCGYELGLRRLNIVTGCGPGAMKGPMKGATIGHAKQRVPSRRYIGISEPGIIAAESPNPIVSELIVMPDIEKRLEAFVRFGHGIIVFPGGVGTAEEILYLLGILLNPDNSEIPFPVIMSGPAESAAYFQQIDRFTQQESADPLPLQEVKATARSAWRCGCGKGWKKSGDSASARTTPSISTGCSGSMRISSCPSTRRMSEWRRWKSIVACRCTS